MKLMKLQKIKIKNPTGHYLGHPQKIEVEAVIISDVEIIQKVDNPIKPELKFYHRYLDKRNGLYKACPKCGDLIGKRSGPVKDPDDVKKICSMFGKYEK
ncbi:MAG: hypothetical protein JW983_09180 [Elusimicrobia bacterium]|nr:hypothetical protein [Elusimicrobiota bacterium]